MRRGNTRIKRGIVCLMSVLLDAICDLLDQPMQGQSLQKMMCPACATEEWNLCNRYPLATAREERPIGLRRGCRRPIGYGRLYALLPVDMQGMDLRRGEAWGEHSIQTRFAVGISLDGRVSRMLWAPPGGFVALIQLRIIRHGVAPAWRVSLLDDTSIVSSQTVPALPGEWGLCQLELVPQHAQPFPLAASPHQ